MVSNLPKHNRTKIVLSILFFATALSAGAKDYQLTIASSSLEWEAKKVTGKHTGTINFSEGKLTVKGEKITGGSLVVDMKSIVDKDLTDAGYNQKLIGHLKSDDFFGVEKFPQSNLEVKNVELKSAGLYHFKADLTIKGITAPVEFDANVTVQSGELSATGEMTVNRTLYGIKYGSGSFFSGLGDKMIYDEFSIKFKLTAVSK
jgi:polyisoprenoid-binding protein YceI